MIYIIEISVILNLIYIIEDSKIIMDITNIMPDIMMVNQDNHISKIIQIHIKVSNLKDIF